MDSLVLWLGTLTNNVLLRCNCLSCHIYIHTNNCDLLKMIVTSTNLHVYCLATVAVAVAIVCISTASYTSWPWCHLSMRMLLNTEYYCRMSNMKQLLKIAPLKSHGECWRKSHTSLMGAIFVRQYFWSNALKVFIIQIAVFCLCLWLEIHLTEIIRG